MAATSPAYLELTPKRRRYVDARLQGHTQILSATMAGFAMPKNEAEHCEKDEKVQRAMIERMQAVADEVDFSRKQAHDMYMDAYHNADTAMEQIAAVNAMVKLHGLEKPKQVEVKHDHTVSGQLEYMPTAELMKLAGMHNLILDGDYTEVQDAPRLEAPEATDGNTIKIETTVPTVSQDY